ncbi:TPA: 3-deoxy-manno-octulosonate cytidylyltransferase [Vibrio diabolicus]|nr:3-deoxy-manno-octulosonate cytidylyltransferase [Vibrio alginolyticus]
MSRPIKVVIPARFGSSRLFGKPLLTIGGQPIFWHVYQRVLEAGILPDDIVLATDDNRVLEVANELNISSVMTDLNHASGTDRLNEVAYICQWSEDTLVINVQGDEPLIPSEIIYELANFAVTNEHFDITTVIAPITEKIDVINPNIVKVALGEDNRAVYFSRSVVPFNREDSNSLDYIYRHIGIYAYSVKKLRLFCQFPESNIEKLEKLEQLRALSNGFSIGAIIIENAPPHGIDTQEDYFSIKNIMESKNE